MKVHLVTQTAEPSRLPLSFWRAEVKDAVRATSAAIASGPPTGCSRIVPIAPIEQAREWEAGDPLGGRPYEVFRRAHPQVAAQ